MNPFLNPEAYDTITIAGVRSPGKVTLSGHKRSEKWDVKDGDGQDGASTTRKGKTPSKFTATFELIYDPTIGQDDFESWDGFLKILRKPIANGSPIALDIYHPDLAELDIKAVVVEGIGGKSYEGNGKGKVTVDFLEYSPPKPKKAKSTAGSKGGSSGGQTAANDPNAGAKQELANLLNQATGAPPKYESRAA
jgi:hypothetical protein